MAGKPKPVIVPKGGNPLIDQGVVDNLARPAWFNMQKNQRKTAASFDSERARKGTARKTAARRPADAEGGERLAGWRRWAARIGLALVVPSLILALAEGLLVLAGWGYPTSFCLRQANPPVYFQNDKFLWQFYSRKTNLRPNPFAVPVNKADDIVRIVVLGESAAAGTPEPAYCFGRILQRMLKQRHPQKRFEVINAAMRGVNSHILLPVARDCARLKPDLFVVYMGNNEVVGLYAPGPRSGGLTPYLHLLRALQWVHSTRLGQLVDPILHALTHEDVSAGEQDAAFFEARHLAADDARRAAVCANFRSNLEDICQAARRSGTRTLLMTVAVNLKDCPPFASLHRRGLGQTDLKRWEAAYSAGMEAEATGQATQAIARYTEAGALDDHFADLHFRLGRCYYALSQFEKAHAEFGQARDWDALQFRTDTRLNEIIRQTARGWREDGVELVDAERAMAVAAPGENQVPGQSLFRDHVHPTFEGDYVLARVLLPAVERALATQLESPAGPNPPVLSLEECAAQLALTRINQGQMAAEIVNATRLPPSTGQLEHLQRQRAAEERLNREFARFSPQEIESASAAFRAAMAQSPDDWQLAFNFGRLRLLAKDPASAIAPLEAARQLLPRYAPIRVGLSLALGGVGRYEEALTQLREALALDPESRDARNGLATIEAQRRQTGIR